VKRKQQKTAQTDKIQSEVHSNHNQGFLPLVVIFGLALAVRLIYLNQISSTTFFTEPYGSAKLYLEWARQILSGQWVYSHVPFLSSILYPYWLAGLLKISDNSVAFIRFIQIVVGSFNCLLIFKLTTYLKPNRISPWIAGIAAALYGFLVFEDTELVMAPLTFTLINGSLILILKAKEVKYKYDLWAGLCLGLACHDRMNLLLFTPAAAWFLGNGMTLVWQTMDKKAVLRFFAGLGLAILPFTAMNYFAGHDTVLLSSSAGVNFFIGNNPQAAGIYYIPPDSGLDNSDLESSASRIASQAAGRELKPSEVSSYWSGKAWNFINQNPGKFIELLGRKFLLFWNRIDIPNNTNFYFVRTEFAPVLRLAFIGFWLVAPLALAFFIMKAGKPLREPDKLFSSFVLVYMISILPFFIADRYRLPVVSVLIIYFAASVPEIYDWYKKRQTKQLAVFGTILVFGVLLVNVEWFPRSLNYSLDRQWIAGQYFNRGIVDPQNRSDDLVRGIVEFKQSIETNPFSPEGHFNLGLVFAQIGYYSGAIRKFEMASDLQPGSTKILDALQQARLKFQEIGDTFPGKDLPLSLYEKGVGEEKKNNFSMAMLIYQRLLKRDPYHFEGYNRLGGLLLKQGRLQESIRIFKKGLKINPWHAELWQNLANAYQQAGDERHAEIAMQHYRKLVPASAAISNE